MPQAQVALLQARRTSVKKMRGREVFMVRVDITLTATPNVRAKLPA
jgi:hypothetical protein